MSSNFSQRLISFIRPLEPWSNVWLLDPFTKSKPVFDISLAIASGVLKRLKPDNPLLSPPIGDS